MIFRVGTPQRMLFLVIASVVWLGIWLSGFNSVHWVLYLPAVFLTFAALTGICPGMGVMKALFGKSES